MYTVGDLAKLAQISVRTLHFYDEVGLFSPSERSAAGHRLYSAEDLDRLQQVLFYKELDFELDEIRELMADPAFDRREALLVQREMLIKQTERIRTMIRIIDKTLESIGRGITMSEKEMFAGFSDFDPTEYESEAKDRWGESQSYKESARRTKNYSKEDWDRIKEEGAAEMVKMADVFDQGVEPDDPKAMDLAETARLAIDRNFYPCSHEMHIRLGEMYLTDERFTKFYDKHRQGLAKWFCAAIKANAAKAGVR